MTREAELRKEIEELIKETPRLTKEQLSHLLIAVRDLKLDWNIDIVRKEAELKGITETNSQWEKKSQDFLKELTKEIKKQADKILMQAGLSLEEYKGELPLLNFVNILSKKHFGGLAE